MFKHSHASPKDLIYCIIDEKDTDTLKALRLMNVDLRELRVEIYETDVSDCNSYLDVESKADKNILKSTEHIMMLANNIAKKMSGKTVGTEHVIIAFMNYRGDSKHVLKIKSLLQKYDINETQFIKCLKIVSRADEGASSSKPQEKIEDSKKKESGKLESSLKEMGFIRNLNEIAQENKENFIGRVKEIDRCVQILCRKKKRNLIIVGEAGTGKSALANGIVNRILENHVPKQLKNTNIYSLDISNIIAGTKYRGQFEERMKRVIDFFTTKTKVSSTILFIDEIHNIIGAGAAEGAVDAVSILKPKLSDGELQCIGATTYDEYRKYILKDSALSRRFSPVFLEEPSVEDTLEIMRGIKSEYEEYHNISVHDDIIQQIVSLSHRYIKNRFFPDKAIDILDEACSKLLIEMEEKGKNDKKKYILTEDTINQVVSEMAQMPISTISNNEKQKLAKLKINLSSIVIGQEKAVDSVSKAIQLSRAGFANPDKPFGVFLFLGQTGCGKSLLARKLSEVVFGTDKIIRLDMSEFMEKHTITKIIGAPPSYIGYDEGSQLGEMVRKKPYSVILLDEIEKAHPQVLNIFLQIFDEGRLTDSSGRLIDFRNTIIIMTSNIATAKIGKTKHIGYTVPDELREKKDIENFLLNEVKNYFSPEFVNRIDEIIVFNKLNQDDIRLIFDIEFNRVKERVKSQNISLMLTAGVKEFLCQKGYDEKYGARPMKRALKDYIECPLAEKIFSGDIEGGDVVYCSVSKENDLLQLKPKRKTKNECSV